MNKDDIITLNIISMGSGGEGIGKPGGFPVFVKDTVPGDTCEVKILRVKKNLAYGKLLKVTEASPDRIVTECPVAGPCGGCTLQAMSYEAELKYKEEKVRDCLLRIGGIPVKVLVFVSLPRKMSVTFCMPVHVNRFPGG